MKLKLFLATLAMGTLALAANQVSLERKYVVGETDTYAITMKMSGAMSMDISMTNLQTVKKVYDNGDADIENVTSDMKMSMAGTTFPSPKNPPSTMMRMTKFGAPVNPPKSATGARRGMNMNFMKYTQMMAGGLEVGKSITINETDPDDPKSTVKGTVTLVGTKDGISELKSSLDVTTAETGDKPMHVDSSSWVGAGGKINKTVAKITNLGPSVGGGQINAIDMTMERKS